jgi:hypothetical protein
MVYPEIINIWFSPGCAAFETEQKTNNENNI